MTASVSNAVKGTFWHGSAQLTVSVSGYIVTVLLARNLGPVEFGIYGLIYSLLVALEMVFLLGVPSAVSRFVAEHSSQERAIAGSGLTLVATSYCMIFGLIWFSAPALAHAFRIPDGAWLFRIAALDLPFCGLFFLTSHILNGRRNFYAESLGLFAFGLTKLVGITVLAAIHLTVAGAFIVNAVAYFIGTAVLSIKARRLPLTPSFDYIKPLLRVAAPMAIVGSGTQLLVQVDLWLLNATDLNGEVKGFYAAAKNIARIPNLLSFVMAAVLLPSLAHAKAEGDTRSIQRLLQGSTRFLLLTLLPGCAIIAIEAPHIMTVLFSEQYAAGAAFLSFLMIANGLLHTVFCILLTTLLALGHQRIGATLAVLAAVAAIIIGQILIASHGAIGAAASAAIASFAAVAVAGIIATGKCGALVQPNIAAKAVIISAALCIVAWLFPSTKWSVLIELIVLSVLLFGFSAMLGVLTREDFTQFRIAQKPRKAVP